MFFKHQVPFTAACIYPTNILEIIEATDAAEPFDKKGKTTTAAMLYGQPYGFIICVWYFGPIGDVF